MTATRLGILIGVAGALAILAWRLWATREPYPWVEADSSPSWQRARPTRPKPRIGAAPNKPESKGPPIAGLWVEVGVAVLLLAAVIGLMSAIAR